MEEIELLEKRRPREKHFLKKDGTIRAEVYDTDVHYLKDGKYEEIDNTLVENNNEITNKNNSFKAKFNKNLNDRYLLKMNKDNFYLNIKLNNMNNITPKLKNYPNKLDSEVLYTNILDNISIDYKTIGNKVKETIILKNKCNLNLEFEVETNLKLKVDSSNIIAYSDDKTIFTIEKPFMVDSNNIRNDNISYNLVFENNNYKLQLILDNDWLQDDSRLYPIYIDPTITSDSSDSTLYDTYIYEGDTDVSRGDSGYIKAGVEKVNGVERVNRTLIKFDLPTIGTGYEVINAYLKLIPYILQGDESGENDHLIEVHRITSDWTENDANWSNMNDKYDERVEDVARTHRSTVSDGTISDYGVETSITGLVKKWYEDTPNYGIMIRECEEVYKDDNFPMFFSKNSTVSGNPQPVLVIEYRNQNGLENYWDYSTQSFTDGYAYVNNHNGNLITSFRLGKTIGGVLPAGLSLIYNTNDVVLNNKTFFGKGFKLNYEQTLVKLTDSIEYLDEDGTIHYFYKNSTTSTTSEDSKYYDEDGLNLTIEDLDSTMKMTDSDSNEMIFTKIDSTYYLTSIKDIDENTITITYNENKSISKVTDKYNNEINIQYDDSIIITSSDSTTVTINYTNEVLTSIVSINGTTSFTYNSNGVIESIEDISGLKTKYEYYENIPYKIKKVENYGLNDELGKYFTYAYSLYETKITDNNGLIETIAFNDYGNAISKNVLTEEDNIDEAYSVEKTYDSKNNITSNMVPISYVNNYLKNTSFEDDVTTFTASDDLTLSYDTDNVVSGLRSLKAVSASDNCTLEQEIELEKGQSYTFSGYFKNTVDIQLELSYINTSGETISSSESVSSSDEFDREDLTISYAEDANSNLKIKITILNAGTIYIDDIQLEKGEVANYFNYIENSNFSDNLASWDCSAKNDETELTASDYINVVNINDKLKALKINLKYDVKTNVEKKFNIKGKKDDTYTLSLWYKNEATTLYAPGVGSNILIFYEPYDDTNGHCILYQTLPITNGTSWQHFSYTDKAIEDFKSVTVQIFTCSSANNLYVTNVALYKDVTREDYTYDDDGNIISLVNQSNNEYVYKYDENNQLKSATNSLGNSLKYEYDINKKSRVLGEFTSSGLASYNTYKDGYPIKSKISKRYSGEIVDGKYKLRRKGTYKYIKAELNMAILEENECSNTVWYIEKVDDKYKIKYNVDKNFSLSYRNGSLVLDEVDDNNLFVFEASDDNLYVIKYYETVDDTTTIKYLNVDDNNLLVLSLYDDSNSCEFYLELLEELFIENDTKYTSDKRFKNEEIDSTNRVYKYNTNTTTGKVEKVTDPKKIDTDYSYNDKELLTKIKRDNIEVDYTYNNANLLSNIATSNSSYTLSYDNFMRMSSISLNNINLYTMEYESNTNNLKKITYANNQSVEKSYDELNRLLKLQKSDNTYKYYYDINGNVSKIVADNFIEKASYDKNNCVHSYIRNDFSAKYTYNTEKFITSKLYKYNDIKHTQQILYDDEKISSLLLDNISITYDYDNLNRNILKNINNIVTSSINFVTNGKKTSNIIDSFKLNSDAYKFEYDELLNISKIYLNDSIVKEYEYDNNNELIKEINYDLDKEIDYEYDTSGNLLTEIEKSISNSSNSSTLSYVYNNQNWKDQLTSYNGNTITYDNFGNIISYNNDVYSWKNGIELASIKNETDSKTIYYGYDMNGIRVSKVYNNVETKYYILNSDIVYEDRNGSIIYYLYDVDGIIGFNYNDNIYYYKKNMFDDIIGILDSNGTEIAKYVYDSWGKIIGIYNQNGTDVSDDMSHIANINPFRYRSYYYDVETELYYLNHRYYNPELRRFISPDTIIGGDRDILSYNLYLYCSNNPIANYDKTGNGSLFKSISKLITSVYNKVKKKINKLKKKIKKIFKTYYSKEPSGIVSLSYGGGLNKNLPSKERNNSQVTTSYNDDGISSDANYGIYGYDVEPNAADLYVSVEIGNTTIKKTFGVDGDYIFSGFDIDYKINDYRSVNVYGRVNVHKGVFYAAYALVIAADIYVLGSAAVGVAATAIEFIGATEGVAEFIPALVGAL